MYNFISGTWYQILEFLHHPRPKKLGVSPASERQIYNKRKI